MIQVSLKSFHGINLNWHQINLQKSGKSIGLTVESKEKRQNKEIKRTKEEMSNPVAI